MNCNNCGYANPPGTKFCRHCGKPLTPAAPQQVQLAGGTWCSSCGALVPAGKRFCTRCGTPVGALAPPPGGGEPSLAGDSVLAELGFPPKYDFPVPPAGSLIATYQTSIIYACLQLRAGKFDDAIEEATLLIDDVKLQNIPQYVMVLTAAYYVRGLAHEQKGDRATARFNFQRALDLSPNYGLAARAFDRVKF